MRLLAVKISFFILFLVIIFFPKNILAIKYSSCDINKEEWHKIVDFDKDISVEIFYNECKLNLKDYRYLAVPTYNKISEKLFVDAHGVWGTGLRVAYNLEQQAELYKQFVYEASINPSIVGADWFQWTGQPATGRFDGENFRIGFVSITDQPYENLIYAAKYINSNLLEWRK